MSVSEGNLTDYSVRKGFLEGVTFNLRPGECAGVSQRIEGGGMNRGNGPITEKRVKSPKG